MDSQLSPDIETTPATGMRREFSLWSAMTLGFVFVSPIVAMYTIFGLGVADVGPGFWWGWVVVMGGQLLVAITFGVLASRWPMAGGVYQWSRRLMGQTYGWFAGWAYMWTLIIAMTAVSYSGAYFAGIVLGVDTGNRVAATGLGIGLVLLAVLVNAIGRRAVRVVAYACIVAEVVGSLGIAVWLLAFHPVNSPSSLGNPFEWPAETSLSAVPLVVATMYAGWSFLGFESTSTLAEEVSDPKRNIPTAIVGSFLGVALVVIATAFAVIVAMPAGAAGSSDPVTFTLDAYLPAPLFKLVMALFVLAYIACLMAINSAVSRIVWSYGRDRELPASRLLGALSPRTNTPLAAAAVTGGLAVALYLPFQNDNIYTLLVTFVSAGFFISFAFPVVGLAIAKSRGTWERDERTYLGKAGHVIAWFALVWVVLETANIVWPRTGDPVIDWAPFVVTAALLALGAIVRVSSLRTAGADRVPRYVPTEFSDPNEQGD